MGEQRRVFFLRFGLMLPFTGYVVLVLVSIARGGEQREKMSKCQWKCASNLQNCQRRIGRLLCMGNVDDDQNVDLAAKTKICAKKYWFQLGTDWRRLSTTHGAGVNILAR